MNITYAEYYPFGVDSAGEYRGYKAIIDSAEMFVPIEDGNRYYSAIQRAIDSDGLVVQPASDPLTPEQRAFENNRATYRASALSKLIIAAGLDSNETRVMGWV